MHVCTTQQLQSLAEVEKQAAASGAPDSVGRSVVADWLQAPC